MTQKDEILAYMKKNNGITTMQAFRHLGVTRLSARIFDLKEDGNRIECETIVVKTRRGTEHVTRYYLAKRKKNK